MNTRIRIFLPSIERITVDLTNLKQQGGEIEIIKHSDPRIKDYAIVKFEELELVGDMTIDSLVGKTMHIQTLGSKFARGTIFSAESDVTIGDPKAMGEVHAIVTIGLTNIRHSKIEEDTNENTVGGRL